jgi:hypothetical protein
MGDVLDLDIQRTGLEQVQPPAAEHTLPGAGGDFLAGDVRHSAA